MLWVLNKFFKPHCRNQSFTWKLKINKNILHDTLNTYHCLFAMSRILSVTFDIFVLFCPFV